MPDKIQQRTLVLLKPDASKRGLIGEVISRFERVGLRIVKAKVFDKVTPEHAAAHYPVTDEWYQKVGKNTADDCEKYGFSLKEVMGTDDLKEVGKIIHRFNQDFLMSCPILALVLEGNHAIEIVRKLVGHTIPVLSAPGTIRGDLSNESSLVANLDKRTVENLVHASGNSSEAEWEIELWFGKE